MTTQSTGLLATIKETMDMICAMALLISLEDAHALADELERIDSAMPIKNPTLYRAIKDNLDGHRAQCQAFLEFRQTLEDLRGEGESHA